MSPKADLLLFNARALTLDPIRPRVSAVAIRRGQILAADAPENLDSLINADTRQIDCDGMTLIPGFHDAHCHFLSLASRLLQLDCSPARAPNMPRLVALIARETHRTPRGAWIRAYGYDERMLQEDRHPTAADLDLAAPHHPVRLDHRSGHATVLNSAAMNLLGIYPNFRDPLNGVVFRDESGRPNGVFLEMTGEIGRMMRPFKTENNFLMGARKANALLLSRGITTLQDAGADNGPEQWRTFCNLKDSGTLIPGVTMMVGMDHANDETLQSTATADTQAATNQESLRLGAVKLMATTTTGTLRPSAEELTKIAVEQHNKGHQLAFHAVEAEAIIAAAQAINISCRLHPRKDPRHRIEHCAEAPPEILQMVKDSRANVVTQPGFIFANGASYIRNVEPGLLPHLYPLNDLDENGIPWAASSDAPISPPDPLLHIQSAVTRQTSDGRKLGPHQSVLALRALKAWTLDAAHSCFQEGMLGSISPGKNADLTLLTHDPTRIQAEKIEDIKVAMTIVRGQIVWEV